MAAEPHVYADKLNEALRRRLEQETHHHTQAQIAAALGVGQTTVARMINDGSNWTMRQLTAFAALRGELPAELLLSCQKDFDDVDIRRPRQPMAPTRKARRYKRKTAEMVNLGWDSIGGVGRR
jgi:hypothetical protein